MFWYKMPDGTKNFGDDLGPYMVSKLTGMEICYVPIVSSPLKTILLYLKGLSRGKYSPGEFKNILGSIRQKRILVTIGSIIGYIDSPTADVWGTGTMFSDMNINKANFYAVRGKYTQARLKALGYKAPDALGDPALLLPLILESGREKKYKLGIIPHYTHYTEVKSKYAGENILIINLLDDIEKVVEDITSCEQTISTSLHGIIVSHAYGIPCLWYNMSETRLGGDDVKFRDYFSSVEIEEYKPFKLNELVIDDIISNIKNNLSKSTIQSDLNIIQEKLLKSAPFPVLDKYLKKLNNG